jgi:hypothetical protein
MVLPLSPRQAEMPAQRLKPADKVNKFFRCDLSRWMATLSTAIATRRRSAAAGGTSDHGQIAVSCSPIE